MPPLPDASRSWVGWQKLPNEGWQRIASTLSTSKGECYNKLMHACELAAHSPVGAEYLILPDGETPRRQDYADRMMRPRS